MKWLLILALAASVIVHVYPQDEVLSQMGVTIDTARDAVLDAVVSGDVSVAPVSRIFLAAPLSTRLSWIRGAFAWARTYTAGSDFLKEYQRRRLESMPGKRQIPESFQEELEKQKTEFDRQILEMRKNLKQLPAEMRPEMEKTIRDMEKQFKEQYGNPENLAMMEQGFSELARHNRADEERRRVNFEKSYPSDPRQMILSRLQSFLELADSVDFAARTEMRDGFRKFADPVFEAKSREWKRLFRAGKAAVDTARAEARAWLTELGEK